MGKNFNGTQINNSATIVEKAGAAITDCRNKILKYDENGDVVLATSGKDIPIGVALIEAGCNDITGAESGKVSVGDDVDILVKDGRSKDIWCQYFAERKGIKEKC